MPIDIGGTGIAYPSALNFLSGYSGLSRMIHRSYDPERAWHNVGPQRAGSVTGGLTFDHIWDLTYNRDKYTILSPSTNLAGQLDSPIFKTRDNTVKPRLGSFTLDMIDWNANLAQLSGSTLGLSQPLLGNGSVAEQMGEASGLPEILRNPLNYLQQRDIDLMSNAPSRLADYAFAFHDIALEGLGMKKPDAPDTPAPHMYQFQKQGSYWAWVQGATPEQIQQMAQYQADRSIDRSRNQYLSSQLVEQFTRDHDSFYGLSSGNKRIDYMAKSSYALSLKTKSALAAFEPQYPGESQQSIYARVSAMASQGGGGEGSVGQALAGAIPFVGTELAQAFDPLSPNIEEGWKKLAAKDRLRFLEDAGYIALGADLFEMVPLFSGVNAVAGLARAGGFASIAESLGAGARTAQLLGQTGTAAAKLYDASLKTANIVMASGLTMATASWAVQAVAPHDSPIAGLARRVDASRIVSHSSLAGVMNATGYLSGFYGIETAVPTWFRAAMYPIRRGARGVPELSFHRELGGTRLGNILENDYDVSWQLQGTAMTSEFMTIHQNARLLERAQDIVTVRNGGKTNINAIDALPNLEDRISAAEYLLHNEIKNAQGSSSLLLPRVMNLADRLAGDLEGPFGRRVNSARQRMQRWVDDYTTQAMLHKYGESFFPTNLDALQAMTKTMLRGLGKSDDLTSLSKYAGADIGRWKMVARRLFQIHFHTRNAELHTAAEGSAEAGRLGMVSQRHLFADEVDGYAQVLADSTQPEAGRALMQQLIATKDDVQGLDAKGAFHTPEELAAVLVQVAPLLPSRRVLSASSAEGVLNEFQRTIEAEGFWSVAYKPTGRWALPQGWISGEMSPPAGTTRVAWSPDMLRAEGYRPFGKDEVMLGTEFNRREKVWPIAEHGAGLWIKEVPGEQIITNSQFARSPSNGGPGPVESFKYFPHELDDDALNLLASNDWVDETSMSPDPDFEGPFNHHLDYAGAPDYRYGSNPGAQWPVLEDANGELWMFKARRGEPLTDYNPARRLAAATYGKLANFLGVLTPQEIPFEWDGVKGTIQRLYEGSAPIKLDPASLDAYAGDFQTSKNPNAIQAMQENQVLDWLMSQHDTNAGSFIELSPGGQVMAVDKGQAFLDFNSNANGGQVGRDEAAGFMSELHPASWWTFRGSMALDVHLGEYLYDWVTKSGGELDRSKVERLIQKIEAIPDNYFANWIRPMADARVATGRYESDAQTFIDMMIERKHNIREAVNRGYEHIGQIRIEKPGSVQSFKPGQKGKYQVDLASNPVNHKPGLGNIGSFDEPPLPQEAWTKYRPKVGVVLEEADGRIWMVEPKNHWQDHMGTFPKGRVDSAQILNQPIGTTGEEFMRQEALRELLEETGFTAELQSHLVDMIDDAKGTFTRYYVARRTGGGPAFASDKETWSLKVGRPEQIKMHLNDIDTGTVVPAQREHEILDHYLNWKNPQQTTPDPNAGNPGMPGDPVSADPEFMSYVRLPSGEVFHSPWLEYPMSHPELIDFGNRGVFEAKLDDIFRGWRTYRLDQAQRASLHRRLTSLDVGLTPAKIDLLHEAISDISISSKVPRQAAVLAQPWMPFAAETAAKIDSTIEKIVGKGPVLHSDGTIANIDWHHELAKAYAQSRKLNLTAGLTSQLYTMGAVGAGASFVGNVIYPALRFAISPFFKLGEIVEAPGLNILRGINPWGGDPFAEGLTLAGITRQRGLIRNELTNEPYLAGMTMFTYFDDTVPTSKTLMFRAPLPEGVNARMRNRVEAGERPSDPATPMQGLHPDPSFADVYPDTYPDLGVDVIIPHPTVDETGAPILQFDGRRNDARRVQHVYDNWINEQMSKVHLGTGDLEEDLHPFLSGIAYVDSLGDDFIPRLARAMTPVHTIGSRYRTLEAMLEDHMANGTLPVSGPAGHGKPVKGTDIGGEAAGVKPQSGERPSTGESEILQGHLDAAYMGLGYWSVGGDNLSFVMKDSVWKKSIITDVDRMGVMYSGPAEFADHLVTPAGAYELITQRLYQTLHGYGRDGQISYGDTTGDLAGTSLKGFYSTNPIEAAVPGGTQWDEIEAVVLPDSFINTWTNLVETYGDANPALKQIKLVPQGTRSVDDALTGYWFEKAGLNDRRFADPAPYKNAPIGTWTKYLPAMDLTPGLARRLLDRLTSDANSAGRLDALTGMDATTPRWTAALNLDDLLASHEESTKRFLRNAQGEYERNIIHGNRGYRQDVERYTNQLATVQGIRRDLADWRSAKYTQAFRSLAEAEAALGTKADTAARAYIAGWHELEARAMASMSTATNVRTTYESTLGAGQLSSLRSERTSTIRDTSTGQSVGELPPWDSTDPTKYDVGQLGDAQAIKTAEFMLDKWRQVRPEAFDPEANVRSDDFFGGDRIQFAKFRDSMVPMHFLDELRRMAYAKTGQPQGQPIVHLWLRGKHSDWTSGRANSEMVISVMGPDGEAFGGLRFDEISDAWKRTALPAMQEGDLSPGGAQSYLYGVNHRAAWVPEGGPDGSLLFYDTSGGQHRLATDAQRFVDDTGAHFRDPSATPEQYIPVRFLYSFAPRETDDFFINLTTRREYDTYRFARRGQLREQQDVSAFETFQDTQLVRKMSGGNVSWQYDHYKKGDVTVIELSQAPTSKNQAADMFDHLLERFGRDNPVRVDISAGNTPVRQELASRRLRNELPDTWVFMKRGPEWPDPLGRAGKSDTSFNEPYGDSDTQLDLGVSPTVAHTMMPEPPPTSLEDVPGSAENITKSFGDHIGELAKRGRADAKAALDMWWNPIPFKEGQQDKLIAKLARDWFPTEIKSLVPDAYKVFRELGVPDREMVDYLIRDRQLLERWNATGSREDFAKLLAHAEQYRPTSMKGKAQQELDSLYESSMWTDMMEVLHWTSKAASDEAFQVHFFSPYRSTFERSINHPLLGVYPASWAYKVAKEWFRFLYDNDMFDNFRLGMAPAVWISQMREQQHVAFAKMNDSGQDLDTWLGTTGPLGSSIFLWNLLMPGDWSALPFPLSRSLRDVLRGNYDISSHFQNNLFQMGIGRDLRIAGEIGNEWKTLITGEIPPLRRGEKQVNPEDTLTR